MKHEGWSFEALSTETHELLRRYEGLLEQRAVPLGLISRADLPQLWDRHIRDSLRGAALVADGVREAADLGSGAGLPGIPLAIALPHIRFTLVDARRSRIAFLELALEDLGLPNTTIAGMRAEELDGRFDLCVARGFAGPEDTWATAERLLREGGRLLYWAGVTFDRRSVPEGAFVEGLDRPGLESGGPIVIMARQ